MLKRQRREYQLKLLVGDLLSILLAHVAVIAIRFGPLHIWLQSYKTVTVLGIFATVTSLYITDQYNPRGSGSQGRSAVLIAVSAALAETIVALTFSSPSAGAIPAPRFD